MSSEQPDSVVESLRQERLHVQKKTFTKWANIHLQKFGLEINDLFQDMGDGLKLMRLLEALSGEKLGKPAKGTSRIKKIENVSRCLMFLHSKKMRLENISSEDIVDGKPHLILGLLWMIILRYEIPPESPSNAAVIQRQDEPKVPVPKIAKDSLLLWCQTKTKGYPRVYVKDFHRSWRDGLAFNALIHSHVPALVDFNSLKQEEHLYNLENAFSIAHKQIGIPRLMDPEDVDTDNPDEKSILVYVSTFCKGLGKYREELTGGKRIANVINKAMETENMKKNYCKTASGLLDWIYSQIENFRSKENLESLDDIQREIADFKNYRVEEKPRQSEKKNEVEVLYFTIQMQRLGSNVWIPPENVSPAAIEKAWSSLQRAEHEHEISIRHHLKEQERLENLAYKFETKRAVREGYISDIQKILTDPNYGANLKQSDATFKKHEAIRTGILAREIMIKDLFKIAEVLIESNYRKKDEIIIWKQSTEEKWNYLLRLLEAFDEKFSHLREVISTLEEIDSILEEMQSLQAEIKAETEPLDISSSLRQQDLREVQIASWAEAVNRFEKKLEKQEKVKDANILHQQVQKLRDTYESLVECSRIHRTMLEEQLKEKEHSENVEEMVAWVREKQLYCTSDVFCKDLASALLLQKKHKSLGSELIPQKELIENMGQEERLTTAFLELERKWQEKEKLISLGVQAYQYISDAEDIASWLSETMNLLSTLDYGSDETTSEALLRRHVHTEEKIVAYSVEIKNLREESNKLCNSLKNISLGTAVGNKKMSISSRNSAIDFFKNCNLSSESISTKQKSIEKSYSDLQNYCQKRKTSLEEFSMYFKFKDRCDEIEKWMKLKEKALNSNDFENQNEDVEKHFEEFLTDMVAHGLIIDELTSITNQLEEGKAKQAKTARLLLDDIQRRWQHLNELTRVKEKNLKGHTSLLLAHRTCEATITLLSERLTSENVENVEKITSFEDLRRKQENIQRELAVAEERVKQALVLTENISGSYLNQNDELQGRIQIVQEKWKKYKIQTKERQRKLEQDAKVQIFKSKANYLFEWLNDVQYKLRMQEKISDVEIAQSVAKEHKDLGDEIELQDYRFSEIEELGAVVLKWNPEIKPILNQMTESKKTIRELWQEKYIWISENLDLQIFQSESNKLQILCTSQKKFLDSAESGETLSDIEILIRHLDSFMDTLKAQKNRFFAFNEMSDKLLQSNRGHKEYIREKTDEINQLRDEVLQKANERSFRLQQDYLLQEFKGDVQEMLSWISEKNNRVLDMCESTKLSSKIKRLESLEAELVANENRLQNIYARGKKLSEECSFASVELEETLNTLSREWNLLCDRLDSTRKHLYSANDLNDFNTSVQILEKRIDEIKKTADSSFTGNEKRIVLNHLKKQEIMEDDIQKVEEKLSLLAQQSQKLQEADCDKHTIKDSILKIEQKLEAAKQPLVAKREKLETCLKFHKFKSEVDRELMWISDQIISLSVDSQSKNVLDAQKHQKKLENLEVTLEFHKKIVENLAKEVLVLVAERECIVDITKTCEQMEEEWEKLLGIFHDKKTKVNFTLKAQMFYSEANEIDGWISEKKRILSSTDYGKDEDMVIKLLTTQKDIELEVDSYKGLVEELSHQADSLIESKNPDSKIIKNRMEIIEQDMKNLQNLCLTRRQKLLESKNEREFIKETEELEGWINEQMTHATSEDFGEDYEHVLLLHTHFEFYRARVEAGSKRITQYEDFAQRLLNSKCNFTDKVQESLDHLSARWSELIECLEARAFKLEAAAEIHRYHRDVTDIIERITNYSRALPSDLGSNLAQAQQLAKKHDATENELLGIEAQLHLLVEDSTRLQDAYPGGNEEHIQMQLALVIENWNSLQQKASSRKESLIAAQRIHKFLSLIREEESWSKQMCFELESDNIPAHIEQISNQHHISEIEIATRLAKYETLKNDGESLLVYNLFHKQIEEKLKLLSEIEQRVKRTWDARCELVSRKKAVILFFNEAKQIQASFATKEVQLCGSVTKETVEDLESALKKYQEFQKTLKVQEEKFSSWETQGENLLAQNIPESDRIQSKLEDLRSRRKRLLNFCTERCETYSNTLRLAKFKRDTIEVETWINEKKNKLRTLLKDYNKLSADEKIKCLQKQQAIQSEIVAHEPIIQRISQQRKQIPAVGEELTLRSELIMENWNEVKGNADRIGRELKEAQDTLIIHGYFEKAEEWIKEKELLIQKNDSGKDYEHCVSLQMKLDDTNSGSKIDDDFILKMRDLATKLSRQENENRIYMRYERINEKWNYLKEEISLYRRKLNSAAEVHAFIKDVDETIDRIREKSMFLSVREEVGELTAAEMVRKKLDDIEKDLTAVDKKITEQCHQGDILSQKYELSAGRIQDKLNQTKRERQELQKELDKKKGHMDAVYTSLKFAKDVDDMENMVSDIIKEMDRGEEPADSADAISLLTAHEQYETKINAWQEKIKSLEDYGKGILKTPGILIEEVDSSLEVLTILNKGLNMSWNYRLNLLTKFKDFHIFSEKVKQLDTWLASKEAFLANKDVGDSMSSVEALIRKHENFEKTCASHYDKIQELEELMSQLRDYDDCEKMENLYSDICNRNRNLQEASQNRKKILHDSKALQELLLYIYEVSNWMKEKIQLVSDDSFLDLTNLLSKTKKHATLEAEILKNHSRVVSITTEADEMIKEGHFKSEEIQQHIQNLEDMWQQLLDLTNERKVKLNNSYNVLKFKQKVEDINSWLDEIESQIELENYAFDVAAIQLEIDKLQEIDKDIQEIGDRLKLLSEVSEKLDHSEKEEVLKELYSVEDRFRNLEDAEAKKYSKLQEDLMLSGLENDINDELSWIEDNIAICQSEEYFDDVISVQVLQKKLEALETELKSREPLIHSIVERGVRTNSSNTELKANHLEKRFQELKDSISLRRLRLSDALESQTYYFEVAQADIWIKEKNNQISSCESGIDLYTVQEMKKKLTAIEAAATGFKENIASLEELSSNLVRRGHYDSHNIKMKQEELNNRYEQLICCVLKKMAILKEDEEYFAYYRDVNSVILQLKAITSATNSTDLGRDVEHVESLLQKVEQYRAKLCGQEQVVKVLQQKSNNLNEGGHKDAEKIKELLIKLEDAWVESDYSSQTRLKALEQAKHYHTFKKNSDETISWIHEKDVAFSSENYGHDLQSVEILLRRHETLEGDMKVIQEQVEALREEATVLSAQYLDYKDNLEDKFNDVADAYENCYQKSIERKGKLIQAQQLQSYFEEARDFQAWIREMSAMITQVDLAHDVADCQAILVQHEGYKSEIDSEFQSFQNFEVKGQAIIQSGHFMAPEIQEKLQNLNSEFDSLLRLWEDRKQIYEQNLDIQMFKKKVKKLEKWLQEQQYYLVQEDGRSLEEVDYLIRKHEQLEQKLEIYETKFNELLKTTKIEEELMHKKASDEIKRSEEIKLEEQRKLEEIRRKEEEKLLEQRNKERVEIDTQREDISDDDFPFHDGSPRKDTLFKPYGSKRSFANKNQHQISSRPQTPVIVRKMTLSTFELPPTTAEGFLQRKHETLTGGKRSTSRGWKTYYTVLCGQLLCFFKDKKSFVDKNAAKPPINILGARCSLPKDYRKKKFVFRLEPTDNSSYLFEAPNDIKRDEWVGKINYTASLPPRMQLMSSSDEYVNVPFAKSSSAAVSPKEHDNWSDTDEHDEQLGDDYKTRTYTSDSLYDDLNQEIDAVYNPIYADPKAVSERSDTLKSYESVASTASYQSSYRTALGASSVSTLQDEHTESSGDENIYSVPEPLSRTRSEIALDPEEHEMAKKRMSLPRHVEAKRQESKKPRWKMFSLRRKQ